MTTSSTDALAERFLAKTLPKPEWTHHAHLKVGLWHLLRHTPDEALDLLRERIRTYNVAVGGENTDTAGYHETITRFYVLMIDRFLKDRDRTSPIDETAEALIESLGAKDLPLQYYGRDRLMSVEARRAWVEPDLRPIEG